jgi:hypothetical protein
MLGERDPFQMLREMPSWLMTYWQAFYEIEPFGDDRADLRSAIAASGIAQAMGADCQPKDFMPFPPEQKPQSGADILRQFVLAGAKIETRSRDE